MKKEMENTWNKPVLLYQKYNLVTNAKIGN